MQWGINAASLQSLLPTLPVFLRFIDPDLARAIYHGYTMITQPQSSLWSEHVDGVTKYMAQWGSWLTKPFLRPFPQHVQLMQQLATFSWDIRSLLGEEKEQRYLVVLQNTSEKRPNGGFFGSFALVTIVKGWVKDIEIVDSYLPQYDNPDTSITGPKWLTNFLPDRQVYFVGANKVWFTYHDGAHIKNLYEKSYPGKKIRGVIFLRTDMFVDLFPDFLKQFREWQFANASIDLIRGQARRWKKELYLTSSQNFVQTHQKELIKALFTRLPELIQKRYINIYLEDVSWSMHTRLRRAGLTTRFEEDTLYSRESNTSFNKADGFVKKTLTIYDTQGKIIQQASGDIIPLGALPPGTYGIEIMYSFDVPQTYKDFINSLEEQYQITLGDRERHILVLDPTRETRGLVYYPKHIRFWVLTGDVREVNLFETPFAYWATYTSAITQSPGQATIRWVMEVGNK